MIDIVLVDDHKIVRQGIRALLETEPDFRVIGEVGSGEEALRLINNLKPGVVVADLMMSGMNGLELTRRVKKSAPETCIIILSMYGSEGYVFEALEAGASSYVLKESGLSDLATAIREAVNGKRYLSPPLTEERLEAYRRKVKPPG